ncbi:hypothetical protein EK21DRAFT_115106 [Setomelanomma holmii]|uniref:Uncharacterized protein n=1 Tax=Setomelanomma holmii TaxID=210430 RepID=A0A9P4LKJ4_9PLEO|nr:hypothetical protein EK21DRAFT_115106 [Setomelanomma holmii]
MTVRKNQPEQEQIKKLQNAILAIEKEVVKVRAKAYLKVSPPEKFDRELTDLKTFLTSMKLYCKFNYDAIPYKQDKIVATGKHTKGKAAR